MPIFITTTSGSMAEAPPFEAKYNTDFDKTLLKRPRVLDYTDEEWYELLDGSALDKFDFGDLLTTLIYYDDGIESARTFSELSTETFDYRPAKDYDKDGHYHPIVVNRVGVSVLLDIFFRPRFREDSRGEDLCVDHDPADITIRGYFETDDKKRDVWLRVWSVDGGKMPLDEGEVCLLAKKTIVDCMIKSRNSIR